MEIYVVRHGETTYNIENKICGKSDVELTSLGRLQAEKAALALKDISFDRVYVSPLKRAIDTAKIITNNHFPLIIDKRIEEIDFGIYEGMDRKTKAFLDTKFHLGVRYSKGESFLEVIYRVYHFLEDVKQQQLETILIVCHGGIMRAIHSYFFDISNDEFFSMNFKNCEIRKYRC